MSDHGHGPFGMGRIPDAAAEFGRLLFEVAQDHLDPAHQRLQWSEGFTGTPSLVGPREYGRKLGWAEPFDAGQAMVYVAVGDLPGGHSFGCGQYNNPEPMPCFSMMLRNGSPALALSRPTRLELHWRRPDESYVFAIVDSTFRNNTVVASTSALPTLEQLEGFVTDPRLVLPPEVSAS